MRMRIVLPAAAAVAFTVVAVISFARGAEKSGVGLAAYHAWMRDDTASADPLPPAVDSSMVHQVAD